MFESLSAILSIIVIDLVLSGDNAVVIGMAARNLSPENRRKAIIFGGAGAIGLRIIFTALATLLLGITGLQAIGGLLLIYIAYKLIRPHNQTHGAVREADSLGQAIRTIVLADVVMSLDNILAVGGAAKGHLGLLMFGLLLSIPIILFGSELVARLLGRFPAFLYVGVFVLIHAAISMFTHDPIVAQWIHVAIWQEVAAAVVLTGILIALARRREQRLQAASVDTVNSSNGHSPNGLAAATVVAEPDAAVPARHGDESTTRLPT